MSLISYLNKIHFADGIAQEAVRAEVTALKLRKPLFVCDADLVDTSLPETMCAVGAVCHANVVHTRQDRDATEQEAHNIAVTYRETRCDGLIALGSSATIDLAKTAGLLISHQGPLNRFAAIEGGVTRIEKPLPPIIAIPTTAGTGAEVSRHALVVARDGRRLGFISPLLVPRVAIYDPTLTLGLPAGPTAGNGMDAITHCIETYVSCAYNPPADGIALDGLRRGATNIRRAVDESGDLEARREMMAAALNGALAFQKGLGGVHALSHALGSLEGLHLDHGTLNAILMPHVLEYNAPAVGDRYAALKQAMGLRATADLATAIQRLTGEIGLPTCLSKLGIDRNAVERAAPLAEMDHTNGTNPRRASAANYRDIMYAAL